MALEVLSRPESREHYLITVPELPRGKSRRPGEGASGNQGRDRAPAFACRSFQKISARDTERFFALWPARLRQNAHRESNRLQFDETTGRKNRRRNERINFSARQKARRFWITWVGESERIARYFFHLHRYVLLDVYRRYRRHRRLRRELRQSSGLLWPSGWQGPRNTMRCWPGLHDALVHGGGGRPGRVARRGRIRGTSWWRPMFSTEMATCSMRSATWRRRAGSLRTRADTAATSSSCTAIWERTLRGPEGGAVGGEGLRGEFRVGLAHPDGVQLLLAHRPWEQVREILVASAAAGHLRESGCRGR